jgi:SAM-dependent methyltransferase
MPQDPDGFHPLPDALTDTFGSIDIYLFDQVLRGRFTPGMRVLDAGCGRGRNMVYFLRAGFDVYGVDRDDDAVGAVRALAARLAPAIPQDHFHQATLDAVPFPDGHFDRIVANAVLHFAENPPAFEAMVDELWRVLRPGGILFARVASSIGLEDRVRPVGDGRFVLPDGTERFLVDGDMLRATTARLGGTILDPIKTVYVEDQRCITNWCLERPAA